MIGDFFYPDDREFPARRRFPSARTFARPRATGRGDALEQRSHKLALSLQPRSSAQVEGERPSQVERSCAAKRYRVEATEAGRQGLAINWRLSMNRNFTVPGVELAEGTPKSSIIVWRMWEDLDGGGRNAPVARGQAVIAVIPSISESPAWPRRTGYSRS